MPSAEADALPLDGVRVLDLTRLLPGPLCTLMLADLGAHVIKVEQPGGEYMRTLAPAAFAALNRNKDGVVIDLKTTEGVETLLRLARDADVFVESFRPGVLDRLGIGVERLRSANPRLIVASLTGYGERGPRVRQAGHDLNYAALAGLLSGLDAPLSVQVADLGGAYIAACAIMAALFRRERTGQGALIESALFDAALMAGVVLRAESAARGSPPDLPREMLGGGLACYGLYRTADGGQMALAALEPKFFAAFCQAAGRPDLIPAHLDMGRQEWLRAELTALFATKTRAGWQALLENTSADTCCTPVLDIFEAQADPAVQARGLWADGPDGVAYTRSPVRLSGTKPPPITPAPEPGGAKRRPEGD
jgi:alpha-methylacyl-CoA racemase